jgi:hypothetical protein
MSNTNKFNLVGISISDSEDLESLGYGQEHLDEAMDAIVAHLLISDFKIAYGGILTDTKSGFTQRMFNLVQKYIDFKDISWDTAINEQKIYMVNYLAWPYYLEVDKIKESELAAFACIERIIPPSYIDRNSEAHREDKNPIGLALAKSECISAMRVTMNSEISARILIGGKVKGYSGILPGLVEEFILANEAGLPIFLVGAFGGCSKLLIDGISNQTLPDELKYKAQIGDVTEKLGLAKYYEDFKDGLLDDDNFKEEAEKMVLPRDRYDDVERVISTIKGNGDFAGLNNGLNREENEVLFKTDDLRTINGLILKGLKESLKNKP